MQILLLKCLSGTLVVPNSWAMLRRTCLIRCCYVSTDPCWPQEHCATRVLDPQDFLDRVGPIAGGTLAKDSPLAFTGPYVDGDTITVGPKKDALAVCQLAETSVRCRFAGLSWKADSCQ